MIRLISLIDYDFLFEISGILLIKKITVQDDNSSRLKTPVNRFLPYNLLPHK